MPIHPCHHSLSVSASQARRHVQTPLPHPEVRQDEHLMPMFAGFFSSFRPPVKHETKDNARTLSYAVCILVKLSQAFNDNLSFGARTRISSRPENLHRMQALFSTQPEFCPPPAAPFLCVLLPGQSQRERASNWTRFCSPTKFSKIPPWHRRKQPSLSTILPVFLIHRDKAEPGTVNNSP